MTTTIPNHIPITRLTDDCLELVFSWCSSCPLVKCTLSQVCKQWRVILHRPTMWRQLTLDKPSLFGAIYNAILSIDWIPLDAIRQLIITKPYESQRHSHLYPWRGISLPNVTQFSTNRLCLSEIYQWKEQLGYLDMLDCHTIETWCALVPLDITGLFMTQPHLRHVRYQFSDVSGFTSLMTNPSTLEIENKIKSISIIHMREADHVEMTSLTTELTLLQEGEEEDETKDDIMKRWKSFQSRQLEKYNWLVSLTHLREFTFGDCFSWTAAIWKQALLPRCPTLETLTLYGWLRFRSAQLASDSLSVQKEAHDALVSCFAALENLHTLTLVDFWVTGDMKLPSVNSYRHVQPTLRRKKIILKYSLESLHNRGFPKEHIFSDIHDFVLYHQTKGHDTILDMNTKWRSSYQKWFSQQIQK